MADTQIQVKVEDWIRREWLPANFGVQFNRERLTLRSGGVFDFDAVSADRQIVASISTSGGKTARGKLGVGKLTKIRSDMLFLLQVECKRRLIVLTEKDMFEVCQKEVDRGRVPAEIEFVQVELPCSLREDLERSRAFASHEVSPRE